MHVLGGCRVTYVENYVHATGANVLPHLALSVTSPHTLATCRARARVENIRLGMWALEARYIPPAARGPFCNAPVVVRAATIRGRCDDASPVVAVSTVTWDDAGKDDDRVPGALADPFVVFGHDRDFLVTVAEHMWRKMHRDARRVRRHALMTSVANLTNAGFPAHARELRGWLLKIKLDGPARTA